MRITFKPLLVLATTAVLAGSAGPAFADDDPPPPDPPVCVADDGTPLPPEQCPGRQASGH